LPRTGQHIACVCRLLSSGTSFSTKSQSTQLHHARQAAICARFASRNVLPMTQVFSSGPEVSMIMRHTPRTRRVLYSTSRREIKGTIHKTNFGFVVAWLLMSQAIG
ncbi:hypothetical protein KCU81_g624, partial [Aureobasidium melanogenum]